MTNGKNIVALVSLAAVATAIGAFYAANGGSNAFHATATNKDDAIVLSFDGKNMKLQMSDNNGGMVITNGETYTEKMFTKANGEFKIASCASSKGAGSSVNVKEIGSGYQVVFAYNIAQVQVEAGVPTQVTWDGKTYVVTSFGWGAGASFTLDGDCSAARELAEEAPVVRATYSNSNCRAMRTINYMANEIYANSDPYGMASCTSWTNGSDRARGCTTGTSYYNYRDVVGISGSNDFGDWVQNILIVPIWSPGIGALVHTGFWTEFAVIADAIKSWAIRKTLFTGHSLGGIVTCFHARYNRALDEHANTIGAPKGFNGWISLYHKRGVNAHRSRVWKLTSHDIVPRVCYMFAHSNNYTRYQKKYDYYKWTRKSRWRWWWVARTSYSVMSACGYCTIARLISAVQMHSVYDTYVNSGYCSKGYANEFGG